MNQSNEQDSLLDFLYVVFKLLAWLTIIGMLAGAAVGVTYHSAKTAFSWIGTFF